MVTEPVDALAVTGDVPAMEVTPAFAIEMEPAPLVMVTPVPCVSVALVSVPPVVLPINSCPLVYVVWPVPPAATGSVPAAKAEALVEYNALLAAANVVRPVPP